MNETIIAWATHTCNIVHGCSKPAAVPEAGLKIYKEFEDMRDSVHRLGQNLKTWGTVCMADFEPRREEEQGVFAGGMLHRWTKADTSPECARCYAESLSIKRGSAAVRAGGTGKGWTLKPWTEANAEENVHLHPERLKQFKTLDLRSPGPPSTQHRIFICSMGDIFHPLVPEAFHEEMFDWFNRFPHIVMLLTKRPDLASRYQGHWPEHVWLGATCGHPVTKWRMEYLRRHRARYKFVSMEPLLASMTDDAANAYLGPLNLAGIDQVIDGGESGTGFRKKDMQWSRDLRDLCVKTKTAYFYKQDSAGTTEVRPWLVEKDGTCLQYRQYPGELTPPVKIDPKTQLTLV